MRIRPYQNNYLFIIRSKNRKAFIFLCLLNKNMHIKRGRKGYIVKFLVLRFELLAGERFPLENRWGKNQFAP